MATEKKPGNANSPRDFDEIEILLQGQDNGLVETPIPAGDDVKSRGVIGLDETTQSPIDIGLITADRGLDHIVSVGGPIPVPQAVDYLIQAARDIEAAHAVGIILGDIRPGNLVLDTTGTLRVLNLTGARIVDANSPHRQDTGSTLTRIGMDVRTVDYMAPEHVERSNRVDDRVDIYSLGCILHFLLTGSAPPHMDTVSKKLMGEGEPAATSLRTIRPDVPLALEACYQKMTARRPEDRPGSMTELVALLLATKPRTKLARPPMRTATRAFRTPSRHTGLALSVLVTAGLLMAAFVAFVVSRRGPVGIENDGRSPLSSPDGRKQTQPEKLTTQVSTVQEQRTIFDGKSGHGWMLCNRASLPPQNIQLDGLNPHRSGSYLVVYDQKLGDFVLDFDYKLASGCNSGVFLRVSDLNNPVKTGIEVALDDTRRGDDRDSGAFHGLLSPVVYAQKPAGQWNHMTITALGPNLAVSINEIKVSSINLDLWTLAGKRPDGSDHQFQNRTIAHMARAGYLGFQDLGGDCWFRNIVLKSSSDRNR
jgi:serine/threonine protein kinase